MLDAFTSGGAQIAGGRHVARPQPRVGSRLRARHPLGARRASQLDGGWYRSDDTSNYLGTYTFESLDAFNAGQPRSYTRRIGDPNIDYLNLQAAVYVQDDIRVRKSLTLSPGCATRRRRTCSDYNDVRAALRRHLGAVQERQDDAARQRRHLLRLAGHRHLRADAAGRRLPPAGAEHHQPVLSRSAATSARVPPTNKYLLADDLQMARNAAVEQRRRLRVQAVLARSASPTRT